MTTYTMDAFGPPMSKASDINKIRFTLPEREDEDFYNRQTELLKTRLQQVFESTGATFVARVGPHVYYEIPLQPHQYLPQDEEPEDTVFSVLFNELLDDKLIGVWAAHMGTPER